MPVIVLVKERNDWTSINENFHTLFVSCAWLLTRKAAPVFCFRCEREEAFLPAWTVCFGSPPSRSNMVVVCWWLSVFFRDIAMDFTLYQP